MIFIVSVMIEQGSECHHEFSGFTVGSAADRENQYSELINMWIQIFILAQYGSTVSLPETTKSTADGHSRVCIHISSVKLFLSQQC